jgi:hypothetical protein
MCSEVFMKASFEVEAQPITFKKPSLGSCVTCTSCQALVETLGFRPIGVGAEDYVVSKDGMKLFGVLDFEIRI